ncbi:DUF4396 domain-containing protein [Affinirhizobium pseudoryzae]|uniref:DUF4396 domain-containing protein n=1 Tax=Allorhizobium pseudoryzae TaxID=379684 RepID=UPI0013EAE101|nr:DUF4396 domain-containing protein [Allorhizobium pseudoryzae]
MFPHWLHMLSILCLLLGIACAGIVAVDVWRAPQHMAVMNIVWPVTALFGTVFVVWAYRRYGRLATQAAADRAMQHDQPMPSKQETPFPVMVGKGALHCGSGCMIGDIVAEWLAFGIPAIALWLGWQSVFAEKMFAVWILDFIFAFGLGIVFQYFAIVPMRKLSPWQGLVAALEADTLSLIAWQVGMYATMAVFQLLIFREGFGQQAPVNSPEFWFAMQIAMIAGFITAYPVNWWLIAKGLKERM